MAYSSNLVKSFNNRYVKINTGDIMTLHTFKPTKQSQDVYSTLLPVSNNYILFHTETMNDNKIIINLLTTVKIEWISRLNPFYIYNLWKTTLDELKNLKGIHATNAKNIINNILPYFNNSDMIYFLDNYAKDVLSKSAIRLIKNNLNEINKVN